MTENELLRRQRQDADRSYLLRVGMFYHAYEGAAYALARLTGYRVTMKQRRQGLLPVAGFPAKRLEAVGRKLEQQGITLRADKTDPGVYWFEGGDTSLLFETPDPEPAPPLIPEPAPEPAAPVPEPAGPGLLLTELLAYDLGSSTPLQALNFLDYLRHKYGTQS